MNWLRNLRARFKKWKMLHGLLAEGHRKVECEVCGEHKWVHKIMVRSFGIWGGFICWKCQVKAYYNNQPDEDSPSYGKELRSFSSELSYIRDSTIYRELQKRPIDIWCCRVTPGLDMDRYCRALNELIGDNVELNKTNVLNKLDSLQELHQLTN